MTMAEKDKRMGNEAETGAITKDDLNDKIDREVERLAADGGKAVKESASSENLEKMNFRNILYNIPMTDEMVRALYAKHDVVDELYGLSFALKDAGSYYDFVYCYVLEAEHDYLANQLYGRLLLENEEYLAKVRTLPAGDIIGEAYKITMMHDIRIAFAPGTLGLSTEQLKAFLSLDSPLESLYQEWRSCDITYENDINDVIFEEAGKLAAKNRENSPITADDFVSHGQDADDGLEP